MKHLRKFNEDWNPISFIKDYKKVITPPTEYVPWDIETILRELESSNPIIEHSRVDGDSEFGDKNIYDRYYTEFEIDGDEITILVDDAVLIPFLRPIVVINKYSYNTGKNKELLKLMMRIYKSQQH